MRASWRKRHRVPMSAHMKYLRYVLVHKWFVLVAAVRLRKRGVTARGIWWRVLVHDLSKLLPSEWTPYVVYFNTDAKSNEYFDMCADYGLPEISPWGASVIDDFQVAWLHHQKRNRHHWQYWLLREDDHPKALPIPMPWVYVVEMVADWMGAGRAITVEWDVESWYSANAHKIDICKRTRERVESALVKEATE